jgi:5'(3')-deoxyribonucleotidase
MGESEFSEAKRIAVDMDGVLADVYSQFIAYHERDFGERLVIRDLDGRPEFDAFPKGRVHVNSKGFFRTAPVILNSREVLQRLNRTYRIFVVSAAMEFPQSLSEKQEWLNEHFPFIGWQQVVFCGTKDIIDADVMIDDHLKNLDRFKGDTFLFSQPHNQGHAGIRHRRVSTWTEIEQILL